MIRIFLFLISINVLNIGVAQDASSQDNAAPLVRGCYLSVDEYLTNSPSFVDSFYVTQKERSHSSWVGTYSLTPRYAGRKKEIRKIWGFCDGENTYVFHQEEYFLITSHGDGNFFVGYDIIDYNDATLGEAFAFGTGNSGLATTSIADRAKSNKIVYRIDSHTGWPIHPDPRRNEGMPAEHVVLYRNGRMEANFPMEILVNDTLQLKFLPNTYTTLKFLSGTQKIKICFGENFDFCNTFELEAKEIDYFKFTIYEITGKQRIIKVTDSEGEFYSDSALKAQQKRERKQLK